MKIALGLVIGTIVAIAGYVALHNKAFCKVWPTVYSVVLTAEEILGPAPPIAHYDDIVKGLAAANDTIVANCAAGQTVPPATRAMVTASAMQLIDAAAAKPHTFALGTKPPDWNGARKKAAKLHEQAVKEMQ